MRVGIISLLVVVVLSGCGVGDKRIQRNVGASGSDAGTPTAPSPHTGGEGQSPEPIRTPGVGHYADVTQFQQFNQDGGKSQAERLAGIVEILRHELRDPGLPTIGLGGGPIDSGYVLEQGTFILGLDISTDLLRQARTREKNLRIRALLSVALAIGRDSSAVEEVRRLAQNDPLGTIRVLSIKGLQRLNDVGSREIILKALNDRYTSVGYQGVGDGAPGKSYPVRLEAVQFLRARGETAPASVVLRVPLPQSTSRAKLYAHLLGDKDPQSALTGVQLLLQQGESGRPYLRVFVEKNRNDANLRDSVEMAEKGLR